MVARIGESSREDCLARLAKGVPQGTDPDAVASERGLAALKGLLQGRGGGAGLPPGVRGSRFQMDIWRAASAIPAGQTRTYRQVAELAGYQARHARAAARALALNPALVFIPCHRVVSASGSLGGYSGGEALKRRLLEIEGALPVLNRGRSR